MRKALLLGGAGFIGVNLARRLFQSGERCVVAHRGELTAEKAKSLYGCHLASVDLANIEDVETVLAREKPDTVIHLASTLVPSSSETEYYQEIKAISLPTMRIIGLLAEKGIRLVYFSSGGAIYGPTTKERLHEDDACEPISFYGQSKLEMEAFIRFMSRTRGLEYLVVRPSNPFGPYQPRGGRQGLIAVILDKLSRGEALEVWGDGTAIRDYIYIDDLVSTVCDLLGADITNLTVNVGSGIGHSLIEVVESIEKVVQRPVELLYKSRRPVDIQKVVLDISKLTSLGASHSRSLNEGIDDYVQSLGLKHD